MKYNFGAGPCILPQNVFEQAAKGVLDFNGLSILEVSHRHKDFVAVMEEARELVKKALNVPAGYTVLFLQGGATLGFTISALNMTKGGKAGYINTGVWASGAIKEAKLVGVDVEVLASSEDKTSLTFQKTLKFQLIWIICTIVLTIQFMEHNTTKLQNHLFRWYAICLRIFSQKKSTLQITI